MNGVNVVLDLWFVLGLDYGVAGVAYATLIAETIGAALALYFCRAAFIRSVSFDAVLWDRARWKHMVLVNRDILLRSLMLQVIFVSFLMIGSDFDDTTLAANQVLLQFLHITAYGMDGFAFAAESLVGQAVGRRDKSALRQSIFLASLWAVALGVGLAITFWVMGPWIISVMSTDDGVQQTARSYLVYMVLSPIFGVLPWMLDGVFIGASRARDMRNMMAISLVVYLGAVVVLVPMFGNQGLWLSMLISFAARGLTLATRYPSLERSVG
jgi:MATE family multidrug resistance protein